MEIDIHIALMDWTAPKEQEIALMSLHEAVQRSPIPIHVHPFPGVKGHIGQARYQGFNFGAAAYVSYVDDDDIVLPHAFEVIARALEVQPDAVFPNEAGILDNGHLIRGLQRHHLPIYRRSLLIDARKYPLHADLAQRSAVEDRFILDLPEIVYHQRVRFHSASRKMLPQYPHDHAHALDRSSHIFLKDMIHGTAYQPQSAESESSECIDGPQHRSCRWFAGV